MNEISNTFALAHHQYNKGNYEAAFALYEQLSVIDPNNYMLLYEMGLVLVRMHEFERADVYFKRAAMDSPYCYRMSVSGRCLYNEDTHIDTELCVYPNLSEMLRVDEYLADGYMCYANYYRLKACNACSRCTPFRVNVPDFHWSKSALRTIRKNSGLQVVAENCGGITTEKIDLFRAYMSVRHNEHNMADPERALAQRHYGFANTLEMNYYREETLVAVGLCVAGKESIYSGFFYHHPELSKYRPGFFSMYMEIALAMSKGMQWYYPGWYVADISNMEYKKALTPAQIYSNNKWIDFDPDTDLSDRSLQHSSDTV